MGEQPFDICIVVSRHADRLADVLARVKAEPGSVPEFVMTGQVRRVSHDEDPKEEWKAWLWPEGNAYPGMDRSVEAVTRASCAELEALLNKRLKARGRWWK